MSLINANKQDAVPQATPDLANSILQQAEQRIESQLTAGNRPNYDRIVSAGMQAGLRGGPKSLLVSLKGSNDPLHDCAVGAVNLVILLYKQSRGTMPIKAMIPAAMTLMLQALDFAQKAGIIQVDAQSLVQATHIFTDYMFKSLGITPQMIQGAAKKVQDITKDPTSMERMKRAAGLVKDPRASTPTPLDNGPQSPAAGEGEGE